MKYSIIWNCPFSKRGWTCKIQPHNKKYLHMHIRSSVLHYYFSALPTLTCLCFCFSQTALYDARTSIGQGYPTFLWDLRARASYISAVGKVPAHDRVRAFVQSEPHCRVAMTFRESLFFVSVSRYLFCSYVFLFCANFSPTLEIRGEKHRTVATPKLRKLSACRIGEQSLCRNSLERKSSIQGRWNLYLESIW